MARKRVADPTRAAVRVMTVHQSKGLEFDHVVLPELDLQLTGQTPSFVIDRPEPTAPANRVCRFANSQVRELLPRDLQKLFESHGNQEVSEALCLLYVALTRAAQSLHLIIAPSKPSEKSLPKTFAGLLRAALTDGKATGPNEVLFVAGRREAVFPDRPEDLALAGDISKAEAPRDQPAVAAKTASPLEGTTIQLRSGGPRRRGLERATPSTLHAFAPANLPANWQGSTNDATVRGTIFHAWLQQYAWWEDPHPGDDRLLEEAREKLRDLAIAADPRVLPGSSP